MRPQRLEKMIKEERFRYYWNLNVFGFNKRCFHKKFLFFSEIWIDCQVIMLLITGD